MNATQPTNELFVSMAKANLYSMAFALPAPFLLGGLYTVLWEIPLTIQPTQVATFWTEYP